MAGPTLCTSPCIDICFPTQRGNLHKPSQVPVAAVRAAVYAAHLALALVTPKLAAIALRRQHPPKVIVPQQLPYWELVKLLLRLLWPLSPRRIFR